MKGTVLDFSIKENTGYISSDSDQRFIFTGQQWNSPDSPSQGLRVDFIDLGDGQAGQVFIDPATIKTQKTPVKRNHEGLYRLSSADGGAWGGVCAGLAEKWGVSVEALRISTVILTFLFLPLFIVYLILWLVLPEINSP